MINQVESKLSRLLFVFKSLFLRVGRYAVFYCCYPFLLMRPINKNKVTLEKDMEITLNIFVNIFYQSVVI